MNIEHEIILQIHDSIEVKDNILQSADLVKTIALAGEEMVDAFRRGNKVILCGNGGSATDALHIEAELVGRFKLNRKALPALAVVGSPATMTSISNDFGYEEVFERQIEGFGREGDVLIAISTSGNSKNVCKAIKKANELGMHTISLTGNGGGQCKEMSQIDICVPSSDTPRIQECHIMIGHILCDVVERKLFEEK